MSVRRAAILALALAAGCGAGEPHAREPEPSPSGAAPIAACVADDERAAIALGAPADVRMEHALSVLSGGAGADAFDATSRALTAIVLLESVEHDAELDADARIAGMLAVQAMGELGSERPGCRLEACTYCVSLVARRCAEELPEDDLTAACPTLRLFARRCAGATAGGEGGT